MKTLRPFCLAMILLAQPAAAQSGTADLASQISAHEAAVPAPLLDRADFIRAPVVSQVKLAPDGRHVAWLATETTGKRLHVMDTRTQVVTALFNSAQLSAIYWARDSETLILDLDSAIGTVTLARPAAPAYVALLDPRRNDYFIAPGDSLDAYVFVVRRPAAGGFALERVSLDGEAEQLIVLPDRITDALASVDGEAVFIVTSTATGHHVSRIEDGSAALLFSCAVLESCELLAWDASTATLWLSGNRGSDLTELQRYANGTVETMHVDPAGLVDLAGVAFADGLPAVAQYHEGTLQNHALDGTLAAHLERIAARFPVSNITPAIGSDAGIWLLKEDSSVLQFSRYHLYDRATGSFTEILQQQRTVQELPESALSRKLPVQYRASDGLLLHGYISLPLGVPLAETPMVALIHGGPLGRITSGFDPFTQFLVNRGYIVFEPNFRASTGYGRRYTESARLEFGNGSVQQDITDGVQFLLAQGVGSPDALAIAGHSFGGASVLAGLAFTPDLFKAGFASAPPAAMGLTLRFQMTEERLADMDPAVLAGAAMLFGDINDPAEMQEQDAKAPLAALPAIKAPLLVIAGADDAQVPFSHVKDYSLALLDMNKPLALFIDEDQGHGIGQAGAATRLEYLYLAETFLGTYLEGRVQPADATLEQAIASKLQINALPGFLTGNDP